MDGFGAQEAEQESEINGASTNRKMFIQDAAIIMHMDFM